MSATERQETERRETEEEQEAIQAEPVQVDLERGVVAHPIQNGEEIVNRAEEVRSCMRYYPIIILRLVFGIMSTYVSLLNNSCIDKQRYDMLTIGCYFFITGIAYFLDVVWLLTLGDVTGFVGWEQFLDTMTGNILTIKRVVGSSLWWLLGLYLFGSIYPDADECKGLVRNYFTVYLYLELKWILIAGIRTGIVMFRRL